VIDLNSESIVGKIILQGRLHLESPLIIGSGRDEFADIEVLKDENGNPFIPGTSIIGVLRHYFNENFPEHKGNDCDSFWGFSEKTNSDTQRSIQSSFICHDLYARMAKITLRDGIKIDPKTQTAEDKGKYNFEIIETGALFDLRWEVTLRQIHSKDAFMQILATIIEPLASGTFSIGAKTNNGFGRCKLENINVIEFDFKNKEDVLKWLEQDFSGGKSRLDGAYKKQNNDFTIEAKFAVKNSIIVRAYSEKLYMPDAANITSNNDFVIPGTSLKGVIRNRALKILKTLDVESAEQKINSLFGIAGEEEDTEKIKSRVVVDEKIIENVEPEQQTRIKIDRFTGGTVKTALFNSMPLWSKEGIKESVYVNIRIRKYQPWEAGLMLQVLKDMWCEDLPIGGEKNVGRGVLKGIWASIRWEDQETPLEITSTEKGIEFSDNSVIKVLNNFAEKIKGEV